MAPDNSHILAQISITAVQFFFYGLHTVLFSLCAYILSNRAKESPRYKLQLAAVILLFVLSTANVALCLSADVLTWCISCHSETRITQISFAGIYLNLVSNYGGAIYYGEEKWKTIIPSIVIAVVSHTSALVLTAWVLPHTLRNAAGIETYSFKDVAAGLSVKAQNHHYGG
ncbi:hypothetical protein VNI00_010069 [Paramarasmius palmivorus]|uniref:Uncharacterized protein n=1 Tax=Paramarasmius palmivorus TaxID=297713 RepID=A0AAW0CJP1_9AGAR